ncbi:MAG: hypothetical protein JXB88_04270 [Spirochaetales bacterium]|nr:hypothetical protein [Spirochaetales bacterium]
MKTDENSMILSSPDNEAIIYYHIINAQKLTRALTVMEDELKKIMSSIRVVNKPEQFRIIIRYTVR